MCRTSRGTLFRRDYYNREIWKPALIAAGLLPDTTFHDLRHTFASTALAEALKQDQEALQLVLSQYDHGLATFLDVLDAQRNVLAVQDQLAQADQTVATDLVTLYKALGGGWEVHTIYVRIEKCNTIKLWRV